MRITWAATILALAVLAAGAGRSMTTVEAAGQAAPAAAAVTVEQFPGLMKTISSGNQAARGKMKANDHAGAATDVLGVATAFGEVEKFFASKNKADAVTWAQAAKTAATAAASALAAGDATKATADLGIMAGTCTQCHTAYREGTPGSYKFKEGAI
jgi:hypothetical protein